MPDQQTKNDVVIAGGGLSGLAMAVCLAGPASRVPLNVVVVDKNGPFGKATMEADGRASAIALSSKRMLEAMGVWQGLAPHAQPVRRIVVTDSREASTSRPALLQFAEPDALEPSAFILENRHLHQALATAAGQLPGLTVYSGAEVVRIEQGRGQIRLAFADGSQMAASLAVAADGRSSRLRTLAGIDTVAWSYGQSAIVTTISHALPHLGRAFEHFRPAGPFAVLPLPGRRSSLVWTEESGDAERIVALADDEFAAELADRLGSELGEANTEGLRQVYSLSLSIAKSVQAPRLALIGDAAHVVHPIAGLGFNLGLRDIAALAQCIGDGVHLGTDPGSSAVLQRYQSWRHIDTMMVAAATDGLNRLFSSDHAAVRLVRDAGLRAVDGLNPLKAAFMREAAGVTGTLPRLLTGEPA